MESDTNYLGMNKKHWDVISARMWERNFGLLERIRNGMPYLEQREPKLAPYLSDIRGKKVIVLQLGDALVAIACVLKGALVIGIDFHLIPTLLRGNEVKL